jgi:hypothetical protein
MPPNLKEFDSFRDLNISYIYIYTFFFVHLSSLTLYFAAFSRLSETQMTDIEWKARFSSP